jgi:hypothetical protein
MYHFSRAIYRELAPYIIDRAPGWGTPSNHEVVLKRCEGAIERLCTDPRHFAKPVTSLFGDIRPFFSMASQLRVYMVVKHHIDLALEYISSLPEGRLSLDGGPRSCQAMTRKGQPCQRPPLPRSEYCPSHQHLTESFEEFEEIEQVEQFEGMELAA